MAEVKITKKDKFLEIQDVLENAGHADLAAFIGDQVALLDKKAAKAKETAAAKKAEDPYLDIVKGALTGDFQTIDAIVAAVGEEDFTNAKASARLRKLVNAGVAEKTDVVVEKRKLVAYKLVD